MGPVTRTGCGALCPGKSRGCYGCFGPMPNAEAPAMASVLSGMETYPNEAFQLLRYFTGYAPAYRQVADKLTDRGGAR
jgi:coenzyme F420-reducing hydrogenase gamma subunit